MAALRDARRLRDEDVLCSILNCFPLQANFYSFNLTPSETNTYLLGFKHELKELREKIGIRPVRVSETSCKLGKSF